MAAHDLTARLARHLDRHLVFPLLESLHERGLYPEEEILDAKLALLGGTNMVDYAMAIHGSLHGTDDVPEDMVSRRAEVVDRLVALQQTGPAAALPLYAFLQDPQLVQLLRPDKEYNVHMLQERFQVPYD
jgi:translation initiation factor 3 subunit E